MEEREKFPNCINCFGNGKGHRDDEGCMALRYRITENCPFWKTKKQYNAEHKKYREQLLVKNYKLFEKYYGKVKKNETDGRTDTSDQ